MSIEPPAVNSHRVALIPAYEPDRHLIDVVSGLILHGFDTVIVDDGSSPVCENIFAEVSGSSIVLKHDINRGKGEAIKTGLKYIREHCEAPYTVVCVDADGQHGTDDTIRVCEASETDRGSLVLGSRRFTGKVPFKSKAGNTITRFVFRISSGVSVYDTQTGLRAFSDELVPALLDIQGERYEYEMNMLMQMARDNVPIREVPIETIYLNDNASSHFNPLTDSAKIYWEILRFSGSSLIGFCVDYLMYCILNALTGQLVFSNIAARVVSATVNYIINRNVVFKSRVSVIRSAVQYILLAVAIIVCNTLLLKYLTGLGINKYLAKIPVEMIMFLLSWSVQHLLIFRNPDCAVKERN